MVIPPPTPGLTRANARPFASWLRWPRAPVEPTLNSEIQRTLLIVTSGSGTEDLSRRARVGLGVVGCLGTLMILGVIFYVGWVVLASAQIRQRSGMA